jgi:hypothetical protein
MFQHWYFWFPAWMLFLAAVWTTLNYEWMDHPYSCAIQDSLAIVLFVLYITLTIYSAYTTSGDDQTGYIWETVIVSLLFVFMLIGGICFHTGLDGTSTEKTMIWISMLIFTVWSFLWTLRVIDPAPKEKDKQPDVATIPPSFSGERTVIMAKPPYAPVTDNEQAIDVTKLDDGE